MKDAMSKPTDDEREALARTIYLWDVAESVSSTTWEDLLDTQRDVWLEAADFVTAAGFRRTEVPEPNVETLPDDCECEEREALVRPEGLVCGTCDKVIEARPEPQGEPSDAPKVVTLDDVYEVTGLEALVAEARSRGEWCCESGCGSGACETCPCCSAGWCVSGVDGVPEDPEDRERWLDVAAEHNPVAAALRAVGGSR